MLDNLFADRVEEMSNGELAEFMKLVGQGDVLSFAGGIPASEVFPYNGLKDLNDRLLNELGAEVFQYCSTDGSDNLKEYIVGFLGERGINTSKKELLITTGSQQALDLISKIFINTGDNIIVEKPGYVGGIGAIKSYQANLIGIDLDKDGLCVNILEEKLDRIYAKGEQIKFIYLVPDYSNPSGSRLSLERRKKILELAERYDFYIIEDTPYSELNYFNERLPFIKEFDQDNRVIMLGSFSKFFIPGMRVGWVCIEEGMIDLLTKAKQNTDLASNTYGQELLALAGNSGLVNEQLKRVKPFYKERLLKMEESLQKFFPENISWYQPEGGFFFWVKLPENIKSRDLFQIAIKNRLAFVTGNSFFPVYQDGNHYIRLSFSDTTPAEIEKGIALLAGIIIDY